MEFTNYIQSFTDYLIQETLNFNGDPLNGYTGEIKKDGKIVFDFGENGNPDIFKSLDIPANIKGTQVFGGSMASLYLDMAYVELIFGMSYLKARSEFMKLVGSDDRTGQISNKIASKVFHDIFDDFNYVEDVLNDLKGKQFNMGNEIEKLGAEIDAVVKEKERLTNELSELESNKDIQRVNVSISKMDKLYSDKTNKLKILQRKSKDGDSTMDPKLTTDVVALTNVKNQFIDDMRKVITDDSISDVEKKKLYNDLNSKIKDTQTQIDKVTKLPGSAGEVSDTMVKTIIDYLEGFNSEGYEKVKIPVTVNPKSDGSTYLIPWGDKDGNIDLRIISKLESMAGPLSRMLRGSSGKVSGESIIEVFKGKGDLSDFSDVAKYLSDKIGVVGFYYKGSKSPGVSKQKEISDVVLMKNIAADNLMSLSKTSKTKKLSKRETSDKKTDRITISGSERKVMKEISDEVIGALRDELEKGKLNKAQKEYYRKLINRNKTANSELGNTSDGGLDIGQYSEKDYGFNYVYDKETETYRYILFYEPLDNPDEKFTKYRGYYYDDDLTANVPIHDKYGNLLDRYETRKPNIKKGGLGEEDVEYAATYQSRGKHSSVTKDVDREEVYVITDKTTMTMGTGESE